MRPGRAPAFWWRARPGALALALAPAAALYGAVAARRMGGAGTPVGLPVVCIGNFVAGGAGKTPVAIEIAQQLLAAGHEPAFVSRGYGGRGAPGPVRVDPARHAAAEVGDEPLLLARTAPCFVARDRVAAARAAAAAGATIVLMDDGLQNPALARNLAVAVVDGAVGVGNGLCLPAGPLRAPLDRQWPAVDLVVVVGAGHAGESVAAEAARRRKPVLRASVAPDTRALRRLAGRPLLAFSGIGRPGKFFDTLAEAGLRTVDRIAFPDHHAFSARDRERLLAAAAAAGATLVTTEKDRMRLPDGFATEVLPIRLAFDDPETLGETLGRLVSAPG
ncbi:tetraacyldisaccharide 4'-kinase [Lichenibacterium ramalinae]|uniref:Tetraacyldisaccharide 4'-kinase n=1 Tax=Lichenibacterium ramalinae TaxID=2316527 RepID=A0A4Q2RC21_9HYPH|nr:tetraacyldisaccharide 4'-kinase [Lichenibacterium ramalinae]RYB04991.1 tetraacyldisaccharide 4'-kinase [Lichenibacterium ramalinae]